jgi:WD40 repeat protein
LFSRDILRAGNQSKYSYEVQVGFAGGALLALPKDRETLYVLDPSTGKERSKHPIGEDGRAFALTPDEKILVVRDGTETTLFAFPSFKRVAHWDQYCNGNSIAISPDGHWLAVCGHEVHVFDLGRREHVKTWEPPESPWAMTFTASSGQLITGDGKRMLRVYDAEHGFGLLKEVGPNRAPTITAIAASPDGRYIAAANDRGTVVLHDAGTLDVVQELKGHDPTIPDTGATSINDVRFDAAGRLIVSSPPKKEPPGLTLWPATGLSGT